MDQRRHMRLGVFVQTPGHHVVGWRHPDATADGWPNLALMKHIAATAEAAKFDMFFLGDGFATGYGEHPSTVGKFEPLTLLSAPGDSVAEGRKVLEIAKRRWLEAKEALRQWRAAN